MEEKPSAKSANPERLKPFLRWDLCGDTHYACLSLLILLFLTANSVVAVIRKRGDPLTLATIVLLYACILALFYFFHRHERAPEGSPERERLSVPIWALATAASYLFAYNCTGLLPLAVSLFGWATATFSFLLGFYFFCLRPRARPRERSPKRDADAHVDCEAQKQHLAAEKV